MQRFYFCTDKHEVYPYDGDDCGADKYGTDNHKDYPYGFVRANAMFLFMYG